MLYQFLLNFVDTFGFLNVFRYLTFRTGLSFFTSLVIVLVIGGPFIKFFSNQKILNPIRDDGPQDHIVNKIGTPTMGGVIILLGLLLSVLFWANLSNINILFCIYIAISFGLLGALDDYKKIKHNNSEGISSNLKFLLKFY
jgi:phospho-N-acetylmuramoyl-pentapeptide-transferase